MMPSVQPRSISLNQASSASMQPIQKPHFVKHLQNQTIKQGNRALMQCIIKGTPDTDVKWFTNGNQINLTSYSPRFPVTYDKFTGLSSLTILDASPKDSGQFTCVATNAGGSETSTAWVVVKGKQINRINLAISNINFLCVSEPSQERALSFEPQQQAQQPQQPFKINARPADRPRQTTPLRFGSIESAKVEMPKFAEPPYRQMPAQVPPPPPATQQQPQQMQRQPAPPQRQVPPPPPPPPQPQQKPVEIVRAYQRYPEEKPAKVEEQPIDTTQMIKPRILEPLRNVEFVEGGQAMFECRVEGKASGIIRVCTPNFEFMRVCGVL